MSRRLPRRCLRFSRRAYAESRHRTRTNQEAATTNRIISGAYHAILRICAEKFDLHACFIAEPPLRLSHAWRHANFCADAAERLI